MLTFRYNYLDAKRDLPPHPFVLSFNNTGRGPNESSLPFQNTGYAINNNLHSFALELNSRSTRFANRFFASYNRFRDFRTPFSADFPTIEIGEGGRHLHHRRPRAVLDPQRPGPGRLPAHQQLHLVPGRHTHHARRELRAFSFFNSFNIFRHGVFFLPYRSTILAAARSPSLDEFFAATDPGTPTRSISTSYDRHRPVQGREHRRGPVLGSTPRTSSWHRDAPQPDASACGSTSRCTSPIRWTTRSPAGSPRWTRTASRRRSIRAACPGRKALFSPRIGFNWNAAGDRNTQIRGGTGIFTGRIPFVWVGNVISNPGANPNLLPDRARLRSSPRNDAILQQSFDVNAHGSRLQVARRPGSPTWPSTSSSAADCWARWR